MIQDGFITCPGCGLKLPDRNLPADTRLLASGECTELFARLSGRTLSMDYSRFIHQVAVDTYTAQHAGRPSKNISSTFALIGLCLFLEHGYTGRQVQQVHMQIPKQQWPALEPPVQTRWITIADVLNATSDKQLEDRIIQWAGSVWDSWKNQHNRVRETVSKYLLYNDQQA